MSFRINPNWGDLDDLLKAHNLRPLSFSLSVKNITWLPIEIIVAASELKTPASGDVYRVNGLPVFIYIRDTSLRREFSSVEEASQHPKEFTRVHLTECLTIREMKDKNKLDKFVQTNSKAGPLRMNLRLSSGLVEETYMDLLVCRHCLGEINWKQYRRFKAGSRERHKLWNDFSRMEFLEHFSPNFSSLPVGHEDDPAHTYTSDWPEISRRARERVGYQCQACRVRVREKEMYLLDAHHKNHRKNDNRWDNLEVLCKLCHAEIHPHYDVNSEQAARLVALRAEQGIHA